MRDYLFLAAAQIYSSMLSDPNYEETNTESMMSIAIDEARALMRMIQIEEEEFS